MLKFLEALFGGNKHAKDMKRIRPIIDDINEIYTSLSALSDTELRAKTDEFRATINERVREIRAEIATLNEELRTEEFDHAEIQEHYERIQELSKDEDAAIADVLDDILPEVFAVVKEVCRRLTERQHRYSVVGHEMTWNMVPYDVQLIGGVVLHEGKIAEMATGEGKTLVGVAPMYLNALPQRGVHLITVNDYLARRDSEWMKPVFDFLGITIGCIQSDMDPQERLEQYNADITYGTNNEFGFDYLRDNMVGSATDMVQQRGHTFAIVDEVDSVLIDEARTPLIISGPVHHTDQRFEELNPLMRRLVEAQARLCAKVVAEAEEYLAKASTDSKEAKEARANAGVALLRAYRGLPKNKRLTKLFQNPDNLRLMKETEIEYLRDQGTRMSEIDEELYYAVDEKNHGIDLTEKGREFLSQHNADKDFFVIPDIAAQLSLLEVEEMEPTQKVLKKDEMMRIYAERSDRIHTVTQLLRAYSLYEKDVEYIVDDGKVKIVDEHTGRILEGRRYSDGLHQAIEAKEGVDVERDTQTLATVTLQNYFRLYKKLAGMTGTAETEAAEFYEIYKLDVVVIPTNRPISRKDLDDAIFRTKREKYNAVVNEVQEQVKNGRAVLVGTTSVEVSELLSKMLTRQKVKHNVLNAKHHQREAEIVAEAGHEGAVTIATNMAGRGTDIKLVPSVRTAGGLCIIGTERHEARRIDRQLRGRSGRQGDPGSTKFYLSLEDDLMRLFGGDRIATIMQKLDVPEGEPIEHSMVTKSVERAQKRVEENNFGTRKRLLEYDNVMNKQREVIYSRRQHALRGERLKGELMEYLRSMTEAWYEEFHPEGNAEGLREVLRTTILCEMDITDGQLRTMRPEEFTEAVMAIAEEYYERKEQMLGDEFMAHLERIAILQTIDDKWREHLRVMDELKEGIHLRAYGQKDPLLEYKSEAFKLFMELEREINVEAVEFAFRFFPQVQERVVNVDGNQFANTSALPRVMTTTSKAMQFSRPDASTYLGEAVANVEGELQRRSAVEEQSVKRAPVVNTEPKIGRNDPCPLDGKKKFKNCCGAEGAKSCLRLHGN